MSSMYKQLLNDLPEGLADSEGRPYRRPFRFYLICKHEYYRGTPVVSDAEFDWLEDVIRSKFPDCPVLQVVGEPTYEDTYNLNSWIETYKR